MPQPSLYARRAAQGLCVIAGCKHNPHGKKLCPKHRAQSRAAVTSVNAARRRAGVCKRRTCDNSTRDGAAHCRQHKLAEAAAVKTRRQRNIAAGRCGTAASHDLPAPGYKLCAACLARLRRARHRTKS